MDDDTILFSKLFYGGMGFVNKSEFVKINNHIRIYYKPNVGAGGFHTNGFEFCAVEYSGLEMSDEYNSKNDDFLDPTFKANVLFHGTSHYDGIRHLHMGDSRTDNENYLYYPEIKQISEVFKKLDELCQKYCSGYDV